MSGAGRSTAAATFEDLGWFVIDNMPASLLPKVAELVEGGSEAERVALVIGRGRGDKADDVRPAVESLRMANAHVRVLFLDASDGVLVRRYEGTRRRHPLTPQAEASGSLAEAVSSERVALDNLRTYADLVIDTSQLNVHQLRQRLTEVFHGDGSEGDLRLQIVSFGFKHGIPLDVDMVFDARFLPNPHWVEELRPLTGLDVKVREYVIAFPDSVAFLDKVGELLDFLVPKYKLEGKSYLTVAVGCTGGQHRSVVLAEELADRLRVAGAKPVVRHRDLAKVFS